MAFSVLVCAPESPGRSSVGNDEIETGVTPAAAWDRASANAPAEAQRSVFVFARLRRSTAASGGATSDGFGSGTGSCTCFISTATGVVPVYGTRPVRHSKATIPSA